MKLQNAKLRQMLSAEYVLGTLQGRARRRFERHLRGDAQLGTEVRFWESQLGRLSLRVTPVDPPETVWVGLRRRIEQGNTVPLRRPSAPPAVSAGTRAGGPPVWRILAGLATAAAVVVVVLLSQPKAPVGTPVAVAPPAVPAVPAAASFVALLKVPESDMQWTVSLTPSRGRMTVAASGTPPQAAADHAMELWWLSPAGPVAIGVLPVKGDGSMALPAGITDAAELKLAVSVEPMGGSPTGQPTGPVVSSAVAVHTA